MNNLLRQVFRQVLKELNIFATRRSLVTQRCDTYSTNSYSILPSLTSIGAITSEGASLFKFRPTEQPVFAFGSQGSGASSLAMALSMLGYRCCSDLEDLPTPEFEKLLAGHSGRVFNAYVNIESLAKHVKELRARFPNAKFLLTSSQGDFGDQMMALKRSLEGADLAILDVGSNDCWQVICGHLRCAPPSCTFPLLEDQGRRKISREVDNVYRSPTCEQSKWDESPWVVEPSPEWTGIRISATFDKKAEREAPLATIHDNLESLNAEHWYLRSDTFTDNMALFRPANIEFDPGTGAILSVRKERLGVRDYSAASLCSRREYLFGRFEAVIQASNVPGVVTGFFLHRNSPRQEIDIEIAGNRPSRLIVNVFFNPGDLGADFNYGYRGTPTHIDLGFDASKAPHRYAIEWDSTEIRWLVDDKLVHCRAMWEPTPIPHLPLTLHVNSWITRSQELAGRVKTKRLPSIAVVRSISLMATAKGPMGDKDRLRHFQ